MPRLLLGCGFDILKQIPGALMGTAGRSGGPLYDAARLRRGRGRGVGMIVVPPGRSCRLGYPMKQAWPWCLPPGLRPVPVPPGSPPKKQQKEVQP